MRAKLIYEKFVEDSDPISDMGIGIKQQIKKFIEKYDFNEYVKSGWESPITYLSSANTDLLDNKTRKEWIEYLMREGKEHPSDWDESPVEEMIYTLKIKFIPNCKELPDLNFEYEKHNDEYFLYTEEWSNFSYYFRRNSDIDLKSIESILSGEADDIFDPLSYDYKLEDILNDISEDKKAEEIFKKIKSICLKYSKDVEQVDDINELFDMIIDDPSLKEIASAIYSCYTEVLASSAEDEAFKDLQNAIKRKYDLTYIENKNDRLVFKISEKGLEDFFKANWFDEFRINYYPPQYGWQGEFNLTYFLEALEDAV